MVSPEKLIQFSGLDGVDSFEKGKIISLCTDFVENAVKKYRNVDFLQVHFKQTRSEGNRALFEVSVLLGLSGKKFSSSDSNWIASKGVSECIRKMEKELKHKFRD